MRIGIHSGACMAGIVGLQMPRYCLFGNTVTLANKMESNSRPGEVHISEETKRRLIRNKYSFTDCKQNVFAFSTYFVTKIDDNYSEDCLSVQTNLSTTGGHFRSPSCSPTHISRTNSTAGTPLAETPSVSPHISPKDSPKQSIYDIFQQKVKSISEDYRKRSSGTGIYGLPDVRISEPTPKHSLKIESNKEREQMFNQISSPMNSKTKKAKVKPISNSIQNKNSLKLSTHELCESSELDKTANELIISEKKSKNIESNTSTTTTMSTKPRKRCFLLFCFGSKKQKSTVNEVRVRPKQIGHELSPNHNSNKKCIKSNVNSDQIEDDISKHLEASAGISATTSTSNTSKANPKSRHKSKRRLACLPF